MPKIARGPHTFFVGYCMNVHPGEELAQVHDSLGAFASPLRAALCPDREMGIGLRLSGKVANRLWFNKPERNKLKDALAKYGLLPFTVNGYPIGDFHAARVKEEAYRPNWLDEKRVNYTCQTADVLADLLGPLERGTVSTLAGSFKPWGNDREVHEGLCRNFVRAAVHMHKLRARTGKEIMVCIEPEPFTTLETTEETVRFFHDWLYGPGKNQIAEHLNLAEPEAETVLKRHLGVCFDTCHQAVEFEDLPASLRALEQAGVSVGKVQLSSALEVPKAGERKEALDALRAFSEDRYYHQVIARGKDGQTLRSVDLGELLKEPGADWLQSPAWRTHYHVPIHVSAFGPLQTTQGDLANALAHLAESGQCTHLEVETYTWDVLPAAQRLEAAGDSLLKCLEHEVRWVLERLK